MGKEGEGWGGKGRGKRKGIGKSEVGSDRVRRWKGREGERGGEGEGGSDGEGKEEVS